eukprot:35997-Eustigmatos_ZCMA.PRE.1
MSPLFPQACSKPKCAALAAPNVALVEAGLKRKVDHLHYASVSTPVLSIHEGRDNFAGGVSVGGRTGDLLACC